MKLYDRYNEYSDEKLINIIIEKDNYQKEAVDTTLKIITERGIEDKLKQELEIIKNENDKQEQQKLEQIERLKNINLKNVINVKLSDAANFDGELSKHGINFHQQDKNLGGGVELYPSMNYYFSDKDFMRADKIYVELGLTDAYQDIKPFLKFEMKVF